MKKIFYFLAVSLLLFSCSETNEGRNGVDRVNSLTTRSIETDKAIVIAEQSQNRVLIVDSLTQETLWEWKVSESGLPDEHQAWFRLPSDAKPIYNLKYILMTSSGGGAAIIRISDKKVMYYVYAQGNPHSAEILPDGNLVVATTKKGTSEYGEKLSVWRVDTLNSPATEANQYIELSSAHNAVWDKSRQLLWATAGADRRLRTYTYNFDGNNPQLSQTAEEYTIPAVTPHELFPVDGEYAMWLSTTNHVYKFDASTKVFNEPLGTWKQIKSVSSGPNGYETLLLKPVEGEYWSDQIINSEGEVAYSGDGFKMYKARWFINNLFSYPENDDFKQPDE